MKISKSISQKAHNREAEEDGTSRVNPHILKRLLWVCFEKYVVVVVYQVLKTVWLTFLWLCWVQEMLLFEGHIFFLQVMLLAKVFQRWCNFPASYKWTETVKIFFLEQQIKIQITVLEFWQKYLKKWPYAFLCHLCILHNL